MLLINSLVKHAGKRPNVLGQAFYVYYDKELIYIMNWNSMKGLYEIYGWYNSCIYLLLRLLKNPQFQSLLDKVIFISF